MDGAAFDFLLSAEGQELLGSASAAYDGTNALALGSRLRKTYAADRVAATLTQVELRRRARAKFGTVADTLYFTADGLEQATHPEVAHHRARRLVTALGDGGPHSLVDLGCGIGSDLMAFSRAGLDVTGVDRDPVTAAVARANLARIGDGGEVMVGEAERADTSRYDVTFVDPARRGAAGRTFDVAAYSPPWPFVERVLTGRAVVKVAPGIPHQLVPDHVEAEWVSLDGGLKEAALWSVGTDRVARRATVLRSGARAATMTDADPSTPPSTATPGRYVYEPDDAVIRAHLVTTVCALVDGNLLDEHLAYVTSDRLVETPFARAFEVIEELPYPVKQLRAALRARDIGPLTVKKRGVSVTPESLRARLGLSGSTPATILLSRTPRSAVALLVDPL